MPLIDYIPYRTSLACRMASVVNDELMRGVGISGDPHFLHHLCQKMKFRLKGGWGLHWYGEEDVEVRACVYVYVERERRQDTL